MITKIVKSNGNVEDFNPEKINKWAEWADNFGVSWSEIVLKAYRKCNDYCSTKDMHKAMIDACVEKEDHKHLKMAGRLLIGSVYKEAFGGFKNIPTLKDFYYKIKEFGHWAEMDYSDEELDTLNGHINHNKDLTYNYTSIRQMKDKYLCQDRVNERVLESPQFMFMGMAMQNMEQQPKERRIKDVVKLYQYLSDMKINAPTPMLVNMRTNLKGYASCCVTKTDDNIESLSVADHIAYRMTAMASGLGSYIHCRSKGDGVRYNTIEHLGKVPYYKAAQSMVHANRQSNRGGAMTMYFNALDPEIEDLLVLKNPTTVVQKQVRDIDYAIVVNSFFAKKVAKNEDWMLVSVKDANDLHEALYSGDLTEFERLYNHYEQSNVKKKTVKARDIAIKALTEAVETGRIYMMWADEMNRHTPFKDKIYSSNLCVAPETVILTKDGYSQICELEDQNVEVWNGFEWSDVCVKKTGENQKLLKVTTDSGYELDATPYHKWYVFDDYHKPYKEVRTHELKVGDKLAKFNLPVIEGTKVLDKAYVNGFYSGDGCLSRNNQRVYLYGEKRKLKHLFGKDKDWYVQEDFDRESTHFRDLKDKFFVPNEGYTIQSRLDWLAGYLDADGCIYRNGSNEQITASSIEKEFLKEVQLMLQTLGVSAKVKSFAEEGFKKLPANDGSGEYKDYWCKESYRLLISSNDSYKLLQLGLKLHRLKIKERLPQRDAKQFVKVEAVLDEGRFDDTYCFNEPKNHTGVFNGIMTGQCLEIALPTKGYKDMPDLYSEEPQGEIGLCSLASIVAGRVEDYEYEDIAYYTVMMIDNVIELMDYPFPSLKTTAQGRRSIGVGITNLAHSMAVNGLTYSSEEGKNFIHRTAEKHSYWLHKASLKLAKERGVCSWINKTKYPEGWLPIDTYNKQVDTVHSQPLTCDWEALRKEIIEVGGLRNSVLEALMPVESSSQLTNTTNSIYPVRNLKVVKTSGSNKNILIAPDMDTLADKYDIAWDVPTKDLIDLYAIVQKFVGQAISSDIYIKFEDDNRKIPTKKLLTDFLYMTKMGMKTRYYINTAAGVSVGKKTEQIEEDDSCVACKL